MMKDRHGGYVYRFHGGLEKTLNERLENQRTNKIQGGILSKLKYLQTAYIPGGDEENIRSIVFTRQEVIGDI